jgi:hypothetical protein
MPTHFGRCVIMGCCQSKVETAEVDLFNQEKVTLEELNFMKTDEDFGEVSLSSHAEDHLKESPHPTFPDSRVYSSRSSSHYMNRADLEYAFLQSSDLSRRKTLEFSNKFPENQ